MTNLLDQFNKHHKMILLSITKAVNDNGGVIKLNKLVGGKAEENFSRRTLLHRLYIQSDLFNEEQTMLEIKDAQNLCSIPLTDLNLNEVYALCQAVDEATNTLTNS